MEEVDKNLNPDAFPEDDTYDLERNSESFEIAPWKDKRTKEEHTPSKGESTYLHTEGRREKEEVSAFRSGVGDNDDLFIKMPESEDMEIPFQYAARHRGRKKHETEIYPEIPFEYGIHYEGEKFTTDNEQPYDHRVDAYPGKTMKYSVLQKDPQVTKRPWEAQLDVHARVRQDILEYAVNWKGKAATESVSGAANLFTSGNGNFIGPGPTSVWNKSGNAVQEIDNRSHGAGIIAKEFYEWSDYEAEYEFKTLKATGTRDDPLAKVVSGGKLYSRPGADDDILGFIFRADKNRKDFYVFLWEGDSGIVTGTRNKSLNGYNVLTGNITGKYTHTKAETKYSNLGIITNMSDLGINPNEYRSGMELTSAQINNYNRHMGRVGWGNQHYRMYKVTNGVMREVNVTYRGNGRGWRQDWFNMNWKNSVKIRCTGREVKVYTQSYKQGNYNENNYQLAVQFNVNSGFETGSVGLLTFSQAVQFDKISVTRWHDIEGRRPATGWNEYKDPGSKQVSSNGTSYVNADARAKAAAQTGLRNPDYEVTSVTGIARDKSKGVITASRNGPVTVKTYNPPDAGQIRIHPIKRRGTATITPVQISPATAQVIFSDIEIFRAEMQTYLNKNPDLIFEHTEIKILIPSNPLDDWDLEGERFTMWRRNPEVIETTKNFEHKVYAYQGWVQTIDAREEFDGLQWATYHLTPVPQTINDMYDEIELKNEKVYMKTTEWYRGTYPADIKNEGIVTNKQHVFVDIPPMPEHYVEPNTEEVMYHGYEDVEFLLIQLKPGLTDEVWMGFKSSFEEFNTNITNEPINIINGRPLIKTKHINDQVEIHCEDWPRFIPWISGKYIGYGKVNGRRPFFKNGLGKADLIDVPTDVVYLPLDPNMATITGPEDYEAAVDGYVYNLSLPIVDISDERVEFEHTNNGDTLRFWSDFMDIYVWYTDWYSAWKQSEETYVASNNKVLIIEDPVKLDLNEDPTYDASNTIIDKIEVVSTNPFVDVWAEMIGNEGDLNLYLIKAEIKEETPMLWRPLVHNGYYYFKEKEHYLYAKEIKKDIHINDEGNFEGGLNHLLITPRPRQGSPIVIESNDETYFRKINFYDAEANLTFRNHESFHGNGYNRYYLKYEDIEQSTLRIYIDDIEIANYVWNQEESFIEFPESYGEDTLIEASYILKNSFYVDINHDIENDTAAVYFYNKENLIDASLLYEGHFTSPFYRSQNIMNPLLNHNHSGFIYLTDKIDKEVKNVKVNVSPGRIGLKGNETVTITAQVLDRHSNPLPMTEVSIYRDEEFVVDGITNEAGEFYYQHKPSVPEDMLSTYRVDASGIENTTLLNFYKDNIVERNYIELKAGKTSIIAGVDDQVQVYATLRDHSWHIVPNAKINFEWVDSQKVKHTSQVVTDQNGHAEITLYGTNEVHGVIRVVATYHEGNENAKSDLYIKSIGG